MVSVSNESALRKKLQEIHDFDCVTFDTDAVLFFIERIMNLLTFGRDHTTQNGSTNDHAYGVIESSSIPDSLRSLLLKISCVFTCKCSGGDSDTATMEILKLLSSYEWEAKIAIVLASFVVEYAQFSHVVTFYQNNPLGELVAILKQITINFDDDFDEIKSTFTTIVQELIKVTKVITRFRTLPSKYISNDVEMLQFALIQTPISVYSMIRVVVTCASKLTGILGQSEISPYAETWNIKSFEQNIISINTTFETQYQLCQSYIEEKKTISYIVKLKLKFDKTAVYSNNQKILQLIFNCKDLDGVLPLSFGTKEVGVEVLKGKTVLLFISDLEISDDDIFILKKFYHESRNKKEFQYEIVWFPIVEMIEEVNEKFLEMKMKMPWYTLNNPGLLKRGMVRFVREEWHYTKKAILVALDPRGKVANPNALHMVSTWGNTAYPFTQTREFEVWSRYKEWNLTLLIDGNDRNIPKWIKEDKIICLYGGVDVDWIGDFVTQARKIEEYAGIKLEMLYIGTNTSVELNDIITGRSHAWEADSTRYFWKRIESMVQTETHHGHRVEMVKESIIVEVRNIHRVAQGGKEWALISHGAGSGDDKLAWGGGDVILEALVEFEAWKAQAKYKGFVAALNGYLAGIKPEVPHVCEGCHRPM